MTIMRNSKLLTVVVCSRNRIDQLARCLESLTMQQKKYFNVLIIDTGTDKRILTLVEQYKKSLRVNLISSDNYNLTYARNLGIRHCHAEIVAFIDDDAIADRCWIAKIFHFFKTHRDAVVVGGDVQAMTRDYVSEFSERLFYSGVRCMPVPVVMGVNMAIHTKRFYGLHPSMREKIFDENILGDTGDDTEMCYYVWLMGGTVWHDPSIVVSHAFRNNIIVLLKRHFQYARGDYQVMMQNRYRDRSLIDDYFPAVKRPVYKVFTPLLVVCAVAHKSIKFVLANGFRWLPLLIARELAYMCGLYISYVKQHYGNS